MAARYDRYGDSDESGKTKIVVGAAERENGGNKTRLYVIIGIVAVVIILALIIYLIFFTNRCKANTLFTQVQLDAMKRSAAEIGSYCAKESSQASCNGKVYYIYTDAVDVASDARVWNYNEVQQDVSGMRYWGTLENVCFWQ